MSAYKLFGSIQFSNANLLVSALVAMGYEAPQVGEALQVRGAGGRKAQIVVPHEQIPGCHYDLGFVWQEDIRAYVPLMEDWASKAVFNEAWRDRLQATYAKLSALTFLARMNADLHGPVRTLADGTLTFSATMEVKAK